METKILLPRIYLIKEDAYITSTAFYSTLKHLPCLKPNVAHQMWPSFLVFRWFLVQDLIYRFDIIPDIEFFLALQRNTPTSIFFPFNHLQLFCSSVVGNVFC